MHYLYEKEEMSVQAQRQKDDLVEIKENFNSNFLGSD